MKILITTLGNKKEQMYFLFKTEKKKPQTQKIHWCGWMRVYRKLQRSFVWKDDQMDYDTQVKNTCKERMEQKGKNKTFHSPINSFQF